MPFRQLSQSKRRAKNALLIGLGCAFLFIPAAGVTLRLLCTYCTWTEAVAVTRARQACDRHQVWNMRIAHMSSEWFAQPRLC